MRAAALLMAAGLALAPASATAAPCSDNDFSMFDSFDALSSSHGRLGVLVMGLTPELRRHFGAADDRGLMVARVEPQSPAASAGLVPGDILVEAGGRTLGDPHDLIAAVASLPKDGKLTLSVIHDGKHRELAATVKDSATSSIDPPVWFRELFRRLEQGAAAGGSRTAT